MVDKPLAAVDLQPLVDKLSDEERIRLAVYALRVAHQLRAKRPAGEESSERPAGRRAGLHAGAIRMSEDFDAPLPDEFWVGS